LFSGNVLGKTNGFNQAITDFTGYLLIAAYIAALLMWWRTSYLVKLDAPIAAQSDERAEALLKALQKRRSRDDQ
ncbi:MAG: hypothetical protein AAFR21_15195, partial [Pseudomonadota bacterium]